MFYFNFYIVKSIEIYLFIVKSHTKYMRDRHTVRTVKTVKASAKHRH